MRQLSNLWSYNNIFVNHVIGVFYINMLKFCLSADHKLAAIKRTCNDSLEYYNADREKEKS